MSGSSKNEARQQAAQRELERRARERETQQVQQAASVDWGTATMLDATLREQVIRLGGLPNQPTLRSTVLILAQQINWPEATFASSALRFRVQYPDISASMSDIEIQHRTPIWCHDFRFAQNASFYADWESDFAAVDPAEMVPFGYDEHYFYLIGENLSDPGDPLVYCIDH